MTVLETSRRSSGRTRSSVSSSGSAWAGSLHHPARHLRERAPVAVADLTSDRPAVPRPELGHLLGTDDLGRDLLSRIIYGSQPTLMICFASIAIGLIIGGTAGMLAAYTGKIVDNVANAIAFIIISFPPLLAILVIIAFWEPPTVLKLTLIFAVASVPQLFVVLRATSLAYVNRDFVTAARTMGAKTPRILVREILPEHRSCRIVVRPHRGGLGGDHRGFSRIPRAFHPRAASLGREHHLGGHSLPSEQQRHLDHRCSPVCTCSSCSSRSAT